MNIPDLINGSFELTGGLLCWANVRRLLRDRKVQGVDWRVSAFFSAWGFWNLFYYPSLAQWASFTGGVLLVIANTTWVVLALRFMKLEEQRMEDLEKKGREKQALFFRHMGHKAYDPTCELCRRALDYLPEVIHEFKCECDLCNDRETLL